MFSWTAQSFFCCFRPSRHISSRKFSITKSAITFTELNGLDHTWWRKYESSAGRWTSPDPLGGSLGDPQSFNAYTYSGNDPVNLIDPTGLLPGLWDPYHGADMGWGDISGGFWGWGNLMN